MGRMNAEEQKQSDMKAFMGVCDRMRDAVLSNMKSHYEMDEEPIDWVKKMIDYNVKGGKMNRGLTVLHAYRTICEAKSVPITQDNEERAMTVGWCIEWLQAMFLVADDVMDDSVTRRGQPCWFRLPHIKTIAINDSFLLESFLYQTLRQHFKSDKFYMDLVELFRETTYQTELGQLMDLTSQPLDKPADLDRFTIERHYKIVKYKTTFYSFYLPVASAMLLSGVYEGESPINDAANDVSSPSFDAAREICVTMGVYFQVQDDFLDCYGDPEVIGKIGTDIQDNKCTWLVAQALERATEEDRAVLLQNYGKSEEECIKKIKELYKKMDIEKLYREYEQQSYDTVVGLIDKIDNVPRKVFTDLLAKIYKRDK